MNTLEKKRSNCQIAIFITGIILFTAASSLGWIKLHYGFNFIDEGYYMTESWRTSVGDDFLEDKASTTIMQYTQINSLIFKLFPQITLLEFRKVQYVLTMATILTISWAMFLLSREFAVLPYIFSLFAFTGLDPLGLASNLSYYTYPHFFLTLYVSFLLFGIYIKNPHIKNLLFFVSGLCLWGISFSMLHLSVIVAAPFIIFAISNYFNFKYVRFTKKNLFIAVFPFCLCWIIFLSIYNFKYLNALSESIKYHFSLSSHGNFSNIHIVEPLKYILICSLFLLSGLGISKIKQRTMSITLLLGLSVLMYFAIETSLFYLMEPYYRGWFVRPMWFSGFLMAVIIIFFIKMIVTKFIENGLSKNEEFGVTFLIPSAILCFGFAFFSDLGPLTVLHSSIPIIAAFSLFLLSPNNSQTKNLLLIFLLIPFYITTAWADWQFTYFDVIPKDADARIASGFGKGIKTNDMYKKIYQWIELTSKKYSSDNDYMLTYVTSPMVYMIAKRRPSLDNTFTDLKLSPKNITDLVTKMESKNRLPVIAYVFERMPILIPKSLGKSEYGLPAKQVDFSLSADPISVYIKKNMALAAEFKLSDNYKIRCFVDKKKLHMPMLAM